MVSIFGVDLASSAIRSGVSFALERSKLDNIRLFKKREFFNFNVADLKILSFLLLL